MGVEDLSLDDIIKQRKASKKGFRPQKAAMYSDKLGKGRTFQQRKRLLGGKPQQQQQGRKNVIDARLLITKRGNNKVIDARQKINLRQKVNQKPIVDARQKIQALHNRPQNGGQPRGKIPKVTISNEFAADKRQKASQVIFHVTESSRLKSNPVLTRTFRGGNTKDQGRGTGIRIAVKNDMAPSGMRSRQQTSVSPSIQKTEMFERLKITTINREAMRRKALAPRPKAPPQRQERLQARKRQISESEDSFEDEPMYGKQQRRRQRADPPPEIPPRRKQEIYQPRPVSRTDRNDLRPMISKQVSKQDPEFEEMEVTPVGPSPIEGTKLQVLNLHPVVSEDDILELFSVLGPVRRARLMKAGEAEVVFIRNDDAVAAYKKYNNRDLDGQPMQIKIVTSEHPKEPVMYSWMKDIKPTKKKMESGEVTELHSGVLQQALFKGGSTGTSTRPVVFTVKI